MMERINFSFIAWISLLALWAGLTFSSALVEIGFTVALIAWVFLKIRTREKIQGFDLKLALPLFIYLGICVLSYFWSEAPEVSGRGALKVFKQVMIFLMVMDLFQENTRKRFFENFFIAVTWLMIINSIFQYIVGYDFLRGFPGENASSGLRICGSFGSYGKLAAYLIATLPYLWVLTLQSQKVNQWLLRKYVTLPALLFSLVLLYWTRSRGAILAFGVGILMALILARKFRYVVLILIAGAGALIFIPRSSLIHLDNQGKEQSLVERYYLWDRAVNVIEAKPLTGTGINTYTKIHPKYDKTQNWRVRNYYAHNGYLQMAAEVGIFGLISFLIFLGVFFVRGIKTTKSSEASDQSSFALLAGILNFLLFAAGDTVLHNPQPVMTFWFLLGLHHAYFSKKAPA